MRSYSFRHLIGKRSALFGCLMASALAVSASQLLERVLGFPRLLGINIGAKNYDEPEYQAALSRFDVIVLGFFPGWRQGRGSSDPIGDALRSIKARNPSILIGQYTMFSEAPRDGSERALKIDKEDWWLRASQRRLLQWTQQYQAYEINNTDSAMADDQGRRFPEWLAERNYKLYHQRPGFDFWFLDGSNSKPVILEADWDRSGHNLRSDDPRVVAAYRR